MANKRLPPLKSLIYFEAAARLQSFTRASTELNVTQGAVSRQIRQLELFLDRDLFIRENRQVVLTDDGHNYYVSIAHLLQQLGDVTETLVGPDESSQVTLVTSGALASMYLLPRIPNFRQQHNDIQIRIVARDNLADLDKFKHDLAFYYSRKTPENCDSTGLFDEEIFPVCSPEFYQANLNKFQFGKVPSDNLIWLESDEDWINWPEWFDAMKISMKKFDNRFVVNNYPMVIQAALAGQGIALAWSNLVDSELDDGKLVRPTKKSLTTGAKFYLMLPKKATTKPETIIFRNWLENNG